MFIAILYSHPYCYGYYVINVGALPMYYTGYSSDKITECEEIGVYALYLLGMELSNLIVVYYLVWL